MPIATPRRDFAPGSAVQPRSYRVFTRQHLDQIPQLKSLDRETRFAMEVVANVLPFRVNEYVLEDLIDWADVPNDPIFRLIFPQKEMLEPKAFDRLADALRNNSSRDDIARVVGSLRNDLNPHPAGQMDLNVPLMNGESLDGMQHKYRETLLFFPSQGQVCHAYCTFCFRWAQFVGDKELRFATNEANALYDYLKSHQGISDLLVTGGDPMVMKTKHLERYLTGLLSPELEHVQTLRIGTKALTFWPYRFVTDPDADDLLRLFERLVNAGKHVALMAHLNHWRELETPVAEEAIRRIRDTGAEIRSQGPVLNHINNDPETWSRMWQRQVRLGIIPYYMFVERDTGARRYFELPLFRTWEIYRGAIQNVSGLGRTARGPSMSADPGKVEIQGIAEIRGEKVFVLRFLQGRNPDWVQRPFFARYNENATWLDDLEPAFGDARFFFEDEFERMKSA